MGPHIRKFVFSTSQGNSPYQNRNRIRHACEECRKRKKRCLHDFQEDVTASHLFTAPHTVTSPPPGATASSRFPTSSLELPSRKRPKRLAGRSRSETLASRRIATNGTTRDDPRSPSPSDQVADPASPAPSEPTQSAEGGSDSNSEAEFVGHLNPEGLFLATTLLGISGTSKYNDKMGFWLPRETEKCVQTDRRGSSGQEDDVSSAIDNSAGVPFSSGEMAFPDPQSFVSFRAIYFRDIHPMFPILCPKAVPRTATGPKSSTEKLFIQAVSVAVATNTSARPLLRLRGSQGVLTPKDFANRLSRSILAAVDSTSDIDRITLVRVFSILSLFSALSTENHISAECCARVVSNSQTLQLHLDASRFRKNDDEVNRIFLCVWALDRLSAVLHSRATLIHERDVSRDMDVAVTQQKGCFGLLLRTCCLLNDVVDLYRPSRLKDSSIDFEFPGFEDLVARAEAENCPDHMLATAETLYHALAILSCRFYSLEDPDRSSASFIRSNLSTFRLVALLGVNFNPPISNFPFVPYSISVALRVSYREFRLSKTSFHRSIAQNQLLAICSLLEKYGEGFPFARRLSWLALKTISCVDNNTVSELPARADNSSFALNNDNEGRDGPAGDISRSRNVRHAVSGHLGGSEIPHSTTALEPALGHAENLPDFFENLPLELNLGVVDDALVHNFGLDAFYDPGPDSLMPWYSDTIVPGLLSGVDGVDVSSSSTAG